GRNRASFMWGSSTYNTRIERLWVEVGRHINQDCEIFQSTWNAKPISGEGHDQSPNDLRFIGQLEHGVYMDDCEGVHPDVINEFYGVHGPPGYRRRGQSGAGH
ncbi:hypothetical protein FPV67DRAFT_1391983, partial [Lyophyllum atratum]